MVTLKWCCRQDSGIKLIEPNDNLAQGYLKMAEDSLGTMNRERSYQSLFAISACYYSMYYSLYAVLMKIGIKCEIHSCTLEFMKQLLKNQYSTEDINTINKAFDSRDIAQYRADKIVSKENSDYIMAQAPLFLGKSKEIISKLNESDIEKIRNNIKVIISK